MTAEKVDGRAVITDEAAVSPLRSGVKFSRIRRLLLDDDSVIHGCAVCEYTAPGVGQVRAHLRVHRDKTAKPGPKPGPGRIDDLTVGQLVARYHAIEGMSDALERMTDDRNEWKTRALKAERAMATLRKALGVES